MVEMPMVEMPMVATLLVVLALVVRRPLARPRVAIPPVGTIRAAMAALARVARVQVEQEPVAVAVLQLPAMQMRAPVALVEQAVLAAEPSREMQLPVTAVMRPRQLWPMADMRFRMRLPRVATAAMRRQAMLSARMGPRAEAVVSVVRLSPAMRARSEAPVLAAMELAAPAPAAPAAMQLARPMVEIPLVETRLLEMALAALPQLAWRARAVLRLPAPQRVALYPQM